ncbi:hypothetical protein EDB81DRAFT_457528 [Dactylonectria macrodidyma]|uniref:Uncharacterized protein n=1 Tax=Dactylonectria macrodidyma TaxID=307937 RepID=A0A9P9EZ07_9HYPO|nr:hypothetical protein EDB81DRAFT_457528 [Dactylonectria macrodidyma]
MSSSIASLLSLAMGATAAITVGEADEWDDFTNNFATDLAPIIVLFGEQATKQFLSESTSFLDNIIFGIAPLGVLTAVVSVIRVYGNASIKAFIGRAQEAHGVAEAELCSSTSEDVCELWSDGGICRVFGRPWILEFFHMKSKEVFYPELKRDTGINLHPPSCGIFLPKEALCGEELYTQSRESETDDGSSTWVEIDPKGEEETGQTMRFAPHPNLSLNIGIKAVQREILFAVAIIGIVMQLSFFGYATWATFHAPELYKGSDGPNLWSFVLVTSGTTMLVLGMTLSARLIEKRSTERNFQDTASAPGTVMFWIQPGGQRIGDQLFNAFAYSEKKKKFVTSWKEDVDMDSDKRHQLFKPKGIVFWTALISSTFGFVCQFIGFRGLHGSIALYQLGLTLLMAIIRSVLRSRRLGRENNKLEVLGRSIEGHELDWQAFNIKDACKQSDSQDSDNRGSHIGWFINDQPAPLQRPACASHAADTDVGPGGRIVGFYIKKERKIDPFECAVQALEWLNFNEQEDGHPNDAAKLVLYRSRLAYLTDKAANSPEQRWDTEVRKTAKQLQGAMQECAEYIFSKMILKPGWREAHALLWSTTCHLQSPSNGSGSTQGLAALPIHFLICRNAGRWEISEWQLEAVLGLWCWSLRKLKYDDDPLKKVFMLARQTEMHNSISAIRLWITQTHDIIEDPMPFFSPQPMSLDARPESAVDMPSERDLCPTTLSIPLTSLGSQRPHEQGSNDGVLLSIRTKSSLLQLLAQDIFTIFISRLANVLEPLDSVEPWTHQSRTGSEANDSAFRALANTHVAAIADIVVTAGIASREDALLSIIPPLIQRSKLPSLSAVTETLLSTASSMRRNNQLSQAENLLQWLVQAVPLQFKARAIRDLGELYRKAIQSKEQSERELAWSSINKEVVWLRQLSEEHANVEDIQKALAEYRCVWTTFQGQARPNDDT